MSAAPVDLPVPEFKIDAKVIDRAGSIAGAYLDAIGKTVAFYWAKERRVTLGQAGSPGATNSTPTPAWGRPPATGSRPADPAERPIQAKSVGGLLPL